MKMDGTTPRREELSAFPPTSRRQRGMRAVTVFHSHGHTAQLSVKSGAFNVREGEGLCQS